MPSTGATAADPGQEPRVVLFGQDGLVADVIVAVLQHEGWAHVWARSWGELVDAVRRAPVWAVLFVCPAPCPASFLHCSTLCREQGCRFVVLTADGDAAAHALAAQRGAVVLPLPFYPHVLRELLRHLSERPAGAAGDARPAGVVRVSRDAVVDFDARQVVFRGIRIPLTPVEFQLLALLARQPGEVCALEDLLAGIGGERAPEGRGRLYALVRALRDKLGDREGRVLRNVHGRGYVLSLPAATGLEVPPAALVCGRPAAEVAGR